MLLNSTKCSSNVGKKTIQAISLSTYSEADPTTAICQTMRQGIFNYVVFRGKKVPPKKETIKTRTHSYKLNLDLGLFPNCRLLPTLLLLRTHTKKTASIKESRVGKQLLFGRCHFGFSSKGWSLCTLHIVLKLKNDPLQLTNCLKGGKKDTSLC